MPGALVVMLYSVSLTTVHTRSTDNVRARARPQPPRVLAVGSLLALAMLSACASKRRPHRAAFATQPAVGRPDTCPDHPIDPVGDGTPGPMDVRCSYRGAAGGQLVQLRGSVVGEDSGLLPLPLGETRVTVRAADGPAILGSTVTNSQGGFTMSLVLIPGPYVLQVDGQGAEPLATRPIEVTEGKRSLTDLSLFVPLDPRLRPE